MTLDEPTLKPIFIFPAHVACVKAVAASPEGGKWLATGSTDEIIKVWDLTKERGPSPRWRITLKDELKHHRTGVNEMYYGEGQLWTGLYFCHSQKHPFS